MLIVINKGDRLSKEDLAKAKTDYQTYIKITVDIKKETVAVGGEYHADAERILLELGSRQIDIWGGGINLIEKVFETNAIINLRAGKNDSADILDASIKNKFMEIVKRVFKNYV